MPLPIHFHSLIPKMSKFILIISCLTMSNLPCFMDLTLGSCAVLFFAASEFTFINRHIQNWVSFPLWPNRFILSGTISSSPLLLPSSILDTLWPGGLIFQCHRLLSFYIVHEVPWQIYWGGMPFPSPVDHVFPELSAMTRPSWVALHGMAHRFFELQKPLCHNKAVIQEEQPYSTLFNV